MTSDSAPGSDSSTGYGTKPMHVIFELAAAFDQPPVALAEASRNGQGDLVRQSCLLVCAGDTAR
jgi:hypothetical protein